MDINKDKIHDLISVFYRNTFKIFYINSNDGENFINPFGMFVSLGITTSIKTLNEIKDILISNGYNACLAEISSKKMPSQFLNTLVSINNNPTQYVSEVSNDKLLTKEDAERRLKDMKSLITSEQDIKLLKELVPKISHLEDIITKLNSNMGWESHLIKEIDGSFQLYHRLINYKKLGDVEYRIGIYVSEDNN